MFTHISLFLFKVLEGKLQKKNPDNHYRLLFPQKRTSPLHLLTYSQSGKNYCFQHHIVALCTNTIMVTSPMSIVD